MVRKLLLSLLVLGFLAGLGAYGASAVFTDVEPNASNTITNGTIDISSSPASAFITYSAMAPGDTVTAPLSVSNNGTLQLRYALVSNTTENTLAAQLDLTVKSNVTTCTNAGFGASGTVHYGPGDLGSISGVAILGDSAQGTQSGDRVLNSGANETLCVQATLPLSTGNAYQGLSTTATFTFYAEQTANNP